MNRSDPTPRSFSTDQLRSALGDVVAPARTDYLSDIVEQAARTRQRAAWTFPDRWFSVDISMRRHGVPGAAIVFVVVSLLVALLAGAIYVGSQTRHAPLPLRPEAWSRIQIESPSITGRVASLAVSPHGLLAAVGGDEPTHLEVSTDGRTWTPVPDDRIPRLSNDGAFGMPFVMGTDHGFLMMQLNTIWSSEDGIDWQPLAGETTDPDLSRGGPDAATAGGPGLVGVGGAQAWSSVDGSDWTSAEVPSLPAEVRARPESEPYVAMNGIAASGDDLIAWGLAEVSSEDDRDAHRVVPLLWKSHDGRTWADAVAADMESVTAVTGGPFGFVATGTAGSAAAIWRSDDGGAWERVDGRAFAGYMLEASVATDAGYVVVGSDGLCNATSCPDREMVIWTSPDGRAWSRVPSVDLFTGARAYGARAWGTSFVILGASDGKPAIWISGSP